jgi:hypothetical protein
MKVKQVPSEAERVAAWLLAREMADKQMGKVAASARYVTGARRKQAVLLLNSRAKI